MDPLMAHRMSQEDLVAQVVMVREEDAGPVETVVEVPRCRQLTSLQALEELLGVRSCCCSPTNVIKEGEHRPGEGMSSRDSSRTLLHAVAGQGIRHDVQAARAILHNKIEAKQLADPLVLRYN